MNVLQRSGKCRFMKTWRHVINTVRLGARCEMLCITVTLCEPDCACVLRKPCWGYEATAQIDCVTVVMLFVNHRPSLMVVEYILLFFPVFSALPFIMLNIWRGFLFPLSMTSFPSEVCPVHLWQTPKATSYGLLHRILSFYCTWKDSAKAQNSTRFSILYLYLWL